MANKPAFEIRKVYSWYEIYIDNTLILKHIYEQDVKDIEKIAKQRGVVYKYTDTNLV